MAEIKFNETPVLDFSLASFDLEPELTFDLEPELTFDLEPEFGFDLDCPLNNEVSEVTHGA